MGEYTRSSRRAHHRDSESDRIIGVVSSLVVFIDLGESSPVLLSTSEVSKKSVALLQL